MMSMIVQDVHISTYMMFAKGADAKIYSLMKSKALDFGQKRSAAAAEYHMTEWAEDGLRTMAFAWKTLSYNYATDWLARYKVVDSDVTEREKRANGETNKIDEMMNEIETDFLIQVGEQRNLYP